MERRGLVHFLLVHVYWNTDLNLVWQVIQEDSPPLKRVVMQILAEQTDR
ncbi:MAG: HepT-like ribonuclease domain-containing protein [Synechococcales bacterium]|nr:HepT-like ribonuclease domain-containing protein [Synechococcales bacterium]